MKVSSLSLYKKGLIYASHLVTVNQ